MTYEEAAAYISEVPKFTKKNAPENTLEMLQRLGHPEENFRIIHVAGTNGKGSVCAFISSVLQKAGYRTGLFTSPHLVRINAGYSEPGYDRGHIEYPRELEGRVSVYDVDAAAVIDGLYAALTGRPSD